MGGTLADRLVDRGLEFEGEGDARSAEREYRNALALAPAHVVALNSLGQLLASRGEMDAAEPFFRKATQADPGDAISWGNLGAALHTLGNEKGALATFTRALKADPDFAGARLNLANLLRSLGRLEEARPHYRLLLERNGNGGQARWNLAALEGLAGNMDEAFALFAQFHALSPAGPTPDLPRWNGESLANKRILLDADQGLGDTIMFARFVPVLRALGARVGTFVLRARLAIDARPARHVLVSVRHALSPTPPTRLAVRHRECGASAKLHGIEPPAITPSHASAASIAALFFDRNGLRNSNRFM